MICDVCVEQSVEESVIPAGVFKLVLCGLNTLGEQQEVLAGLDRLHHAIRLSKTDTVATASIFVAYCGA